MVGANLSLVDCNPLTFAKPLKDLADLETLETIEFLPPVLRRKNDMVLTVPASVR